MIRMYYFAFEYNIVRPILLSVVIPTFNRPDRLARCIESLARQNAVKSDWEVIVVNDGGMDIGETLKAYSNDLSIAGVDQVNSGPASARNLGVERSRGAIIAFIDDDCVAEPDWVGKLMDSVRSGELVGGKVDNLLKGNIFSETCQTLIDYLYERLAGTSDNFFTSNNMGIHKEDFKRLGGFDTGFETSAGEDREFCVRATQAGIRLRHDPEIRVGHTHSLTFISYLRLHFKYGRAAHTYRKAVDMKRIANLKGGGRGFYLHLLIYPLKRKAQRPLVQSLLLAISQACTIGGYLYERLVRGR
jgi:glycosyltransferase involved in cell wall biosynthesis